jgi:TolB-like protein
MAAARIRMLGTFLATAPDGVPLAFPTRKTEALLARLSRHPGERTSRARLAGLLWPDRPDAQGRASLRQALTALRRVLESAGAAGPSSGGDVVLLPADAVEVDVVLLERELAREAPDGERIAALCRGPLLADFPPVEDAFDAWIDEERMDLSRRILARLRALLPQSLALHRAGTGTGGGELESGSAEQTGLALADAALALDPRFEPAYRARMAILARRGDRAAALQEYERCRAVLARETGVGPGRETEALREEVVSAGRPVRERARPARSLAILPFEILEDDPRHALLARGLYEDLVGALSRFRTLRVIARDSVERLARRASDVVETGRTVGAGYLLATSVRAGIGRLRLSLRLVEAESSRQLWADRFDVDLAGAFEAQDRITRAVTAALAVQIEASELEEALRRPPERLEAYECWLRGMHGMRRGTREADLEARRLFERALEMTPGFARAYSGLSLSYFNDWSCAAWERWDETERKAYDYALEATRLDDRDHVTHCILGRILLYRREYERGIEHLRRAVALNPNDADVLAHACIGHGFYGDPGPAVALEADARAIHPFHPDWYFVAFGVSRFVARQPREALERLERAADLVVDGRAYMAAARAHLGDVEGARADARCFVERFARAIAGGRPFAPEDSVRWILRVNPLRRDEDRAHLLDGLARAGVVIPPGAAAR